MKKDHLVIGLTGNIACGKSTVAHMLADLGLPIIDADALAREVTAVDLPAYQKIVQDFGNEILNARDKTVNRAKLRTIIFADPEKRKLLESIVHPAIKQLSELRISEFIAAGAKIIIYEASLIIETGRDQDFDGILLITASPQTQIARLLQRSPDIDRSMAKSMIESQWDQNNKIKAATWVIDNNDDMVELEKNVRLWLETIHEVYAKTVGSSTSSA